MRISNGALCNTHRAHATPPKQQGLLRSLELIRYVITSSSLFVFALAVSHTAAGAALCRITQVTVLYFELLM